MLFCWWCCYCLQFTYISKIRVYVEHKMATKHAHLISLSFVGIYVFILKIHFWDSLYLSGIHIWVREQQAGSRKLRKTFNTRFVFISKYSNFSFVSTRVEYLTLTLILRKRKMREIWNNYSCFYGWKQKIWWDTG